MVLESEDMEPRILQTDQEGSVRFTGVPCGLWELRCVAAWGIKELHIRPDQTSETAFQISVEQGVVRVLNQAGAPIPKARVRSTRVGSKRDVGVLLGITDTNGEVAYRPLDTDTQFEADAAGYLPSSRRRLTPPDPSVEIQLKPGGGTARGTVLEEGTREPIQGARVTIGNLGGVGGELVDGVHCPLASPISVRTNAQGHFEAQGLPYGNLSVEVKAANFGTWSKGVQVYPMLDDARVEVEALLTPALVFKGRILNQSGNPEPGAVLYLKSDSGIKTKETANEEGAFRIENLSPGEWQVHVQDYSRGGQAWEVLHLEASQTKDLILTHAHTVAGKIVDEAGNPVAKAKVGHWIGTPGGQGGIRMVMRSDAEGNFLFFVGPETAEPVTMAVFYPDGARFPCHMQSVQPGTDDLYLVLNDKLKNPARITARSSSILKVQQLDGGKTSILEGNQVENGEVDIKNLPAGPYEIHRCRSATDLIFVGRYTLAQGEHLDLGSLD